MQTPYSFAMVPVPIMLDIKLLRLLIHIVIVHLTVISFTPFLVIFVEYYSSIRLDGQRYRMSDVRIGP